MYQLRMILSYKGDFMKESTSSSPTRESLKGILSESNESFPDLRASVDTIFYTTQGGPFNIRQLAMTVEQDKELNNSILSICRSNFYSGKTPIRQISQAVRRLGPVGFQGVSIQAFLDLDVYYNPAWQKTANSIKLYSNAVAHACRIISQSTSKDSEMAFLLGILHRIGISVTLLQLPNPSEDFTHAQRHFSDLQQIHPSIAQFVLQKWGMSEELINVIGNYGQLIINDKPNTLSAILIAAEHIIKSMGKSEPIMQNSKDTPVGIPRDSFEDARSILEIRPQDIPQIVESVQETLRSEV